jgi:hypothetical protein
MLESLARDKRSSLIVLSVSFYEKKSFIILAPGGHLSGQDGAEHSVLPLALQVQLSQLSCQVLPIE